MKRNSVNLFTRKGKASKATAERLANMGASTRDEVLRMLANDANLMGLVFDQATRAGVIVRDGCGGWVGRDTEARQSAAEDWEP